MKRNVYSVSYTPHNGFQKSFQLNFLKKKTQTECVFRFSLPTRLTKAVSEKFEKKRAKRNVYSVSQFTHGLRKPFHKTNEKKMQKRNVYSVSDFPHGFQMPFHKTKEKKNAETECVFRF